ncbi:hypothetical protein E5D57_003223 [Metarhizium anisopliae]|nr:hypothetical protein E5D57_003223 [Metarhizium anisopliae]
MFRLSRGPKGGFHSQENNSKEFCYGGGHLEDDGIIHIRHSRAKGADWKAKTFSDLQSQGDSWWRTSSRRMEMENQTPGKLGSALLFEYMRHVSACIFYSQYFAYRKYALGNAGRQNYKRHENAKICIQNPHQTLYNTATTITTIFDP